MVFLFADVGLLSWIFMSDTMWNFITLLIMAFCVNRVCVLRISVLSFWHFDYPQEHELENCFSRGSQQKKAAFPGLVELFLRSIIMSNVCTPIVVIEFVINSLCAYFNCHSGTLISHEIRRIYWLKFTKS